MVKVDCKGLPCPQPLIATRKAMRENAVGTEIEISVDNETARGNVTQMLADFGVTIAFEMHNGLFVGRFTNPEVKEEASALPAIEEVTCPTTGTTMQQPTLLCATNVLGVGDDILGTILMKGFLSTLAEWTPRPKEILFLNAGVKLCTKESGALDTLKALEASGVELLICGTCVDFYKIREQIAVGTITNMQRISQSIAQTSKLVRL